MRETHALSSWNLRTLSEKQRVYISCPDWLAGEQSYELGVHFTLVKVNSDKAAQRNPAQYPRSRLR